MAACLVASLGFGWAVNWGIKLAAKWAVWKGVLRALHLVEMLVAYSAE